MEVWRGDGILLVEVEEEMKEEGEDKRYCRVWFKYLSKLLLDVKN